MRARTWFAGSLGLAVAIVACAGYRHPPSPRVELLRCGRGSGTSQTKLFGPEQTDSLIVSGHKLIIPAGALSEPTEVTMWEPPTQLIKVRLRTRGQERFRFAGGKYPVLAVNYARCSNAKQIAERRLSVYRLRSDDREDAAPLESTPLPSTLYPDQQEVRATLSRLSGYGVGQIVDSPI